MIIYDTVLRFDREASYDARHIKRQFAKQFPEYYQSLLTNSHLTPNSSWKEILYCVQHQITTSPQCANATCSNIVRWNAHTQEGYKTFCSPRCSIHLANQAARSEGTKIRRRATVQKKYGTDNPSRVPEVKEKIRQKALERWDRYYSETTFRIETVTRKQYDRMVWRYSEWQYRTFIDEIDPGRKRGREWHLDHVFSRSRGYISGAPVEVIGSRHNLRLIPASENLKKGHHNEITLGELMSKVGNLDGLISYAEAEEYIEQAELERKSKMALLMSQWRKSPEYRKHYYRTCEHCGIYIDPGNYAKHHGDQCQHRSP